MGVIKNKEIFSMTAHYCEGLDHGFFRIDILDTTGANGQSIINEVNRMVIFLI